MNHLEENHEDELSIFTPPLTNTGVHTRQWIEYRPTNQISGESPLEFLIPPQSVGYMDLRRSTLTHQRPKTARRQRRLRRIGSIFPYKRLFASGLQSPTDFRYADRNQLPVQSLHRHATGDGCQRQSATGLANLREGLAWIP
jgi:hypothetical protein